MAHRIKLGELLVRAGILDEARLKVALAEKERSGGRLGSLLVRMGFIEEGVLVKALSKQLAVPVAKLDSLDVPSAILEKIDQNFAMANGLCPLRYNAERKTLQVAMSDPINVNAIDEMIRMTGLRIEVAVAGERALLRAIPQLYGADAIPVGQAPLEIMQGEKAAPPAPPPPPHDEPFAQPSAQPEAPTITVDTLVALERAQRRQRKAIRAMAELLVEKGVISREEYLTRLTGRGA